MTSASFDQAADRPKLRAIGAAAFDADGIDIRDLLHSLWRGRWKILFWAILGAALAAFAVAQVTPRYAALSQVLLDPRESRLSNDTEVVSDLELNDQVIASEISIMQSNILIEAVIAKIDARAPGALDMLDPERAEPGLRDLVMPWAEQALRSFVDLPEAPPEPTARAPEDPAAARLDRLIWVLRQTVDIWRDGDAYIINIRAETPDARLSTMLAAGFAEEYIDQQLEGRQRTANQVTQWIETRLTDLRAQVETAEDAVEDYRAQSLVAHGSSLEVITQRMLNLNEELVRARVARVAAEARYSEIDRLIAQDGFDALGSMLTSDSISDLNARRLDILREDADWAQNYARSHPERRKLATQLEEVTRALNGEFQRALDAQRNELQIAQIKEVTLRDTLNGVEQQFLDISRSSIGLRQLEREAEAARTAYKELLDRVAETRTQEQFQQADARIIERATEPGAPSAPRPKLMTALGLLAGATLGLVLVLFRSLTRQGFRSLTELEAETGLPVLASFHEGRSGSVKRALKALSKDPAGPGAEALRALRNELGIGSGDSQPRSVALLSALPSESKSRTTLLLARVAEMADKLTIVVDCDLRQSSVQGVFRWKRKHDLTDLMRGDCELFDAVNTETGLGFDVLAARGPVPDASDMLRADWLEGLLEELKDYYDVVLVNCPALLPVSDAMVVAQAVDQRVFLVRHNATPRVAVQRCLSNLAYKGLGLHGLVLTRVNPKDAPKDAMHPYGYGLQER